MLRGRRKEKCWERDGKMSEEGGRGDNCEEGGREETRGREARGREGLKRKSPVRKKRVR